MPYCLIMASFISRVNGPCMQMMSFAGKPSDRHFSSEAMLGRTRGQALPASGANAASSLLPVVSSTLPGMSSSISAASAASRAESHSPLSSPPRRRRTYSSPSAALAAAMVSVAALAYGWVASTTMSNPPERMRERISPPLRRPTWRSTPSGRSSPP